MEFPPAEILPGELKATLVIMDGRVVPRNNCLLSSKMAVELDRRLSDCIFGQVHGGIVLEETKFNNVFNRTPKLVAVKVISKKRIQELGSGCSEDPVKEMAALQYIGDDHPNVLGQLFCIQDPKNYYSVMEFMKGGEMFANVQVNGRYSESLARIYFKNIIDGLEHVHKKGIYYRDLSLENIMLTGNGSCKIIDFGMCVLLPRDEEGNIIPTIKQLAPCGKQAYLPPEIYMQSLPTFNAVLADIWSLGTVLATMLIGGHLFKYPAVLNKNYRRFFQIGLKAMLEQWKIELSDDAINLVEKILKLNPDERPSLEAIRADPWLNA